MEELESALKKYNMGDEKTIKEIIAEVDTDHVINFFLLFFAPSISIYFFSIIIITFTFNNNVILENAIIILLGNTASSFFIEQVYNFSCLFFFY